MKKPEPVYIPIVTAMELVKGYCLEEILSELVDEGFIDEFRIGTDLVRIETSCKKDFEIMNLITEDHEINLSGKIRKKSNN